jgi:ribulose-5-phosphate 4-epimerase/fuculose-1-phosphate aldolase
MTDEAALRAEIVALGASMFDRGLSGGSSGNISVRLADGWLMTPTNASLGRLHADRISKLNARGDHVGGDTPTKEALLHLAMYAERPQARAVVHLHSTYSVALACRADVDADDVLPALTPYAIMKIGKLPLVPYRLPGDARLGDDVRVHAAKHTAVLLANHGPVVAGASLEAAVNAIEELEETARLAFILHGHPTRLLTRDQIAEIHARYPV